jgi:hypothetical protein
VQAVGHREDEEECSKADKGAFHAATSWSNFRHHLLVTTPIVGFVKPA